MSIRLARRLLTAAPTAVPSAVLALLLAAGLAAPLAHGDEEPPTERNKELARRFVEEVYNRHQFDKIPDFIGADFIDRSPGAPPNAQGPAFVLRQAEGTYAGFPDLKFEILRMVAEEDLVAIHWSSKGTASDEAAGGGAGGKSIEIQGISIFRYDADGKVVESWDLVDRAAMMRQLGFEFRPPGAREGE